jgi:hypothetical protein
LHHLRVLERGLQFRRDEERESIRLERTQSRTPRSCPMKKFPRKVVVEQIAALVAAISSETLEEVQGGVTMNMAYGVPTTNYDELEPSFRRGPREWRRTSKPDDTKRIQSETETDAAGRPTE